MHRSSQLVASLALAIGIVAAPSAHAAVVNLVNNGSFENGLNNWTHTGTTAADPAVTITYGSASPYPTGAFGEAVPAPNDATFSPDAAGIHGAYFVDDHSVNEGLSQMVYLVPGAYNVGFDVYAPFNGYSNPIDATFSARIAGLTLANYAVSTEPAGTWLNFTGFAQITTAGLYDVALVFNTPGQGAAKDVVIDRVFVASAVPEPETLALFGIAMGALAVSRKRPKA